MNTVKKIFVGLILAFLVMPFTASAINGTTHGTPAPDLTISKKLENPIKAESFSDLVATLIDYVITILFPFLVIAFIYVGFLFVQAQGKEDKIIEAKSAFLWTVVGAFILMGAWGFSKVLESTVKTLAE